MQKESGASRWWLWVTVWFYDDIKDIIEICRVAAYLNQSLHLTANSSAVFERLCPAFKQVVFQGLVLRSVGGR